jgi:hypothetical protein
LQIDGEHFHDSLTYLATFLDQQSKLGRQTLWQELDPFLSFEAVGQDPPGVPLSLSAMTRWLATTPVGHSQMAAQAILGQTETSHELVLALPKQ